MTGSWRLVFSQVFLEALRQMSHNYTITSINPQEFKLIYFIAFLYVELTVDCSCFVPSSSKVFKSYARPVMCEPENYLQTFIIKEEYIRELFTFLISNKLSGQLLQRFCR